MLPMSVCVALSRVILVTITKRLKKNCFLVALINPATLVTQSKSMLTIRHLNPTKPIGSFFTEQEAELLTKQGYTLKEDAGRGYRRVVASPKPVDIIEKG